MNFTIHYQNNDICIIWGIVSVPRIKNDPQPLGMYRNHFKKHCVHLGLKILSAMSLKKTSHSLKCRQCLSHGKCLNL